MLKTIDEACDFITDWFRETGSYAGQRLSIELPVPESILRLNARVGELWRSSKAQPSRTFQHASPLLGLLDGQDKILNPIDYARDENGVVPFVRENQDVWLYGFDPNDVDQLLVSGDWCDGLRGDFQTEWRCVAARPEDALVCTLLINLCMRSDANWDDDVPKPDAAHTVLWRHPAWSNFDGFWIDDERTLIYFSGWGGYSRTPRVTVSIQTSRECSYTRYIGQIIGQTALANRVSVEKSIIWRGRLNGQKSNVAKRSARRNRRCSTDSGFAYTEGRRRSRAAQDLLIQDCETRVTS
jgi:hypothetical protein